MGNIIQSTLAVSSLLCTAYQITITSFRFLTLDVYNTIETISLTLLEAFLTTGIFYYNFHHLNDEMNEHQIISIIAVVSQIIIVYYSYLTNVIGRRYEEMDLSGRVYIITGCNTGIGYETAKALVRMNATVIMACRSIQKAEDAKNKILQSLKTQNIAPSKLIIIKLDLNGFDSVRKFVKNFRELNLPLHGLINNAGIMLSERTLTQDGFEVVFTANHLSHFLLTNLLLKDLENCSGRIINVSSTLHRIPKKFDFDDIMSEKYYELFYTYGKSKLANILFTKELQKRMKMKNNSVKVLAVHPGTVRTEVTRHMHWLMQYLNNLFSPLLLLLQKTPEQGAYCSIYCATDMKTIPYVSGGELYFHCQPIPVSETGENMEAARLLWHESAKLTGIESSR